METLIWIIVAIVVIGLVVWLVTKKKGPETPKEPEEPPSSPSPPPSETPGI